MKAVQCGPQSDGHRQRSDTQNQANAIDGYDRSTDALQDREEKAGTDDDDPRARSRCDNPVGGKIPLLRIDFR